MLTDATSTIAKTSLDYSAEGYWQDFLAGRPIAGGIAYEQQLHDCQLDESLASLQRIDILITQVRRDIAKSSRLNETIILADERYRNLLLLLAFYAGRVLSLQWQHTPQWYGQFELGKRYPDLMLAGDDFYQHMAVVYNDNAKQHHEQPALFFALEPIGLRLFGNIDRQFVAVQGGQVASGLYQAVSARLPDRALTVHNDATATAVSASNQQTIDITKNAVTNVSTDVGADKSSVNKSSVDESIIDESTAVKAAIPTSHDASSDTKINASPIGTKANLQKQSTVEDKRAVPDNLISTEQVDLEPVDLESVSTKSITNKPELIKTSVPNHKPIAATPEIFTQLLIDLNDIEVSQTAGNTEYQQACKILDQFERHIARQDKPRAQVTFLDTHLTSRQQALLMLQDSANAGNTAAMLRLAMYELLGEGLINDLQASKEAGVELVKQAANAQDSRAQRLLSRIYYQGLGVVQDIDNGRYWLEQAAKNGHIEAATVVAQWQQAEALITTQKQEQNSFKRYQLLIAAIAVGAILLIILV